MGVVREAHWDEIQTVIKTGSTITWSCPPAGIRRVLSVVKNKGGHHLRILFEGSFNISITQNKGMMNSGELLLPIIVAAT